MAEAIYWKELKAEVVMVRFPIVLGVDDTSLRFKWHVDRIKKSEEIFTPNLKSRVAFVHSEDAGKFLSFLADKKFIGAINCCSDGDIGLNELIIAIELVVGKKAVLSDEDKEGIHSPFGFTHGFKLKNNKAIELGFKFLDLNELVKDLAKYYNQLN